jgi:type II secretory pathway component PulJ
MLSDLRRRARRDDEGMTVVELVIATALMLLVTTLIFSFMISVQNTDRRAQAVVSNEQDARFVLTEIARDIRASNPVETFETVAPYRNQIQLYLGEGATQKRVRWVYDTNSASATYKQIRREVLDNTTGAVLSSSTRLKRVQNIVRNPVVDLFQYYSQTGVDLVAAGDPHNVGNCSIRVKITITADSNPGPEPFTVTQDVEVRNRLPGGIGCPI